jgi:DNA-binding transcriptional regulator YiaG
MEAKELIEVREELFENNSAAMAAALNTPKSTYWKWENGARRIPGIIVPAIAHVRAKMKRKKKS